MKSWILVVAACVVGGLSPLQGSLNAQMGQLLGHPLKGALVNFSVGGILLCAILALFVGFPNREALGEAPWYLYTAGVIGLLFVTTLLALIPVIGALRVVTALVVGQLIMSAVIDHFGILNVPVVSLGMNRIAGMMLLMTGLYLIQR
ncbi:MAG: DMT family transporter [Candidatus Latescibacterota bacterium]|nr:DMT family transporter [Candidatus Latescibacterota bacterium]